MFRYPHLDPARIRGAVASLLAGPASSLALNVDRVGVVVRMPCRAVRTLRLSRTAGMCGVPSSKALGDAFESGLIPLAGVEPTLRVTVRHVVGNRPDEQMVWPNARRIVAVVAGQFVRAQSSAKGLFQRQSMRSDSASTDLQDAVVVTGPGTHPNPTIARLVDLLPEPINEWTPGSATAVPGSLHYGIVPSAVTG